MRLIAFLVGAAVVCNFLAGGVIHDWIDAGQALVGHETSGPPAFPDSGPGESITTIQDRMVADVAEQCATMLSGRLDDECRITLTNPAEEASQFRELLNAWN